jgi:hypothetical protein
MERERDFSRSEHRITARSASIRNHSRYITGNRRPISIRSPHAVARDPDVDEFNGNVNVFDDDVPWFSPHGSHRERRIYKHGHHLTGFGRDITAFGRDGTAFGRDPTPFGREITAF